MVKTQTQAPGFGAQQNARPHFTIRSNANTAVEILAPRQAPPRAVPTPVSRLAAEQSMRSRTKVVVKRSLIRGELAAIIGVVSLFAVGCLLGIVYLAAFAKVAAQGREIHSLLTNTSVAEAQNEILVTKLAQASSGVSVQQLAQKQGMVLSNKSVYVTLTTASPAVEAATQVASAQ